MKLNGIRKYINGFFLDFFFKKISAKKKLTKNSLFNTSDFSEWIGSLTLSQSDNFCK